MLVARIVGVVVAVASLGCADVCQRAQALNSRFPDTHAACFANGSLERASFDAGACSTSMKQCSDADEAAISTYLECLERLPACTPETKDDFASSFLNCASGMTNLSEGCFVTSGS